MTRHGACLVGTLALLAASQSAAQDLVFDQLTEAIARFRFAAKS